MSSVVDDPARTGGAQADDAPPAALRAELKAAREARIARFRADQNVSLLLRGLARDTDHVLQKLWRACRMPADWALLAVGGYGRGELQPASDVDLLLLIAEGPDAEGAGRAERFIGCCWDIGLEIGHSVRTPRQCVEQARADITVMTSLTERRGIAGAKALRDALDAALDGVLSPAAFYREKLLEMRQRHQKYEDTPYSLEPNCKESPGALRDLQVIAWVARAAGLGEHWRALVESGVIEPLEASQLRRHEQFLKKVRAWLHIVSGRREDRLVFDLQPAIAQAMGLKASGSRALSEALMQRYYLAAKMITQLTTLLLLVIEQRVLDRPPGEAVRIDDAFDRVDDLLDLREPDAFDREPRLILRAFNLIAGHSGLSGMTARTLRAIWHARFRIDARFRADPVNRAAFMTLLQAPRGVTHELRRMNKWSVLGRYLPAFRRIVGRMQHDLFHVYTVDQHILMVVRNLRRFMLAEHAHEYPLCSQLAADFERPWILIVAALFHDIAKGRGGDHSVLGQRDVARFCLQHGIGQEDSALAEFLVLHHLRMSMTAQKRDLSDPAVIQEFAALVGTERRLVALYLLTVADIRGTSAKVWNAWKGKLLEDLFKATLAHLAGNRLAPSERMDFRRSEAARLLLLDGIDRASYQRFWESLDIGYFLRHEPGDIAWHTRVLHAAPTGEAVVRTRMSPLGEGFEVVVYAPDQPGLFARICHYFDRKNLSILDARVHTTRSGHALDSFMVVDPAQHLRYRDVLRLVEVELSELLARDQQLDDLRPAPVARQSRRSRAFPLPPKVDLRPDEGATRYHLSVTATDRTGLLYDIARVLAQNGVNLSGARVTTLGERVEDMFTVESKALAQEKRRLALERELLATL
ncbi:MAG: [protein-PII] uridylyltransferase [Lautropia sp.]